MGEDILQYVLHYNIWQAQIGIRPPPRAAQQWWKLIKTYETYVCRYLCMGILIEKCNLIANSVTPFQNSAWNSKGWLVQYKIVYEQQFLAAGYNAHCF